MKSLIRWSATLSLVGSILFGSLFAGSLRVLALTAEQVMERLRTVPVFTLTDSQGSPLVATPNQGENRAPVAGVFISRRDAQAFLENLKQRDPQAAQGVQVVPVSLAEVYNLAQQSKEHQNQQDQLHFAFIPVQQQVEEAKNLLRQSGSGQQADQFQGVPLFIARASGQNGGYLTVKQGNDQVIPVFFDRQELQALLDRLKQVQPDLASNVTVQVVNLEGLIQTLQTSDNTELNQVMLVPPQESVDFVRSLQQQGGGQQGGGSQGGGQQGQPRSNRSPQPNQAPQNNQPQPAQPKQ
jgi:nickel transport protein